MYSKYNDESLSFSEADSADPVCLRTNSWQFNQLISVFIDPGSGFVLCLVGP